eukprot:scaffold28244_cov14-Tisochrysis_lutea.AAC.1
MPPMPMPFGISLPSVFSTSTNTSTSSVSTPPQALKHSSPTSLSTPQCCVHPLRPHPPTTDAPLSPRPVRELDEGSRLQPTDAKGLQSKRLTAGFESSNPATAAFSEAQLQGTATRDSGPAPAPPATRGRFMFATQVGYKSEHSLSSRSLRKQDRVPCIVHLRGGDVENACLHGCRGTAHGRECVFGEWRVIIVLRAEVCSARQVVHEPMEEQMHFLSVG